MKRRRSKNLMSGRAGNTGIIASFVVAFAGIAVGGVSVFLGEVGAAANASRASVKNVDLRDGPYFDPVFAAREKVVRRVLTGAALERLPTPEIIAATPGLPKVAIVFDDMGIDQKAYARAVALPGPLTFSFLPYANNVAEMARHASENGVEIMLHLPMEPQGVADPGPQALMSDMTGAEFIKKLQWNLSRFDGFIGVNNHMGSKLTADEAAMKTVLGYLKREGLFFLDSVTSGDTIVRAAGAMVGAEILSRDVFIDAETGSRRAIRKQLALVEQIARETGYVVAICHPRKETLDVLGPWLATAPQRGFELVPVSTLVGDKTKPETIIAQKPDLRL